MKPGRELDALVAEKVMGHTVVNTRGWLTIGKPDWFDDGGITDVLNPLPNYSEEIAAAWEVVEKYHTDHWEVIIYASNREAKLTFWNDAGIAVREGKAFGDSVPHAICLAALEAVGYEI